MTSQSASIISYNETQKIPMIPNIISEPIIDMSDKLIVLTDTINANTCKNHDELMCIKSDIKKTFVQIRDLNKICEQICQQIIEVNNKLSQYDIDVEYDDEPDVKPGDEPGDEPSDEPDVVKTKSGNSQPINIRDLDFGVV
jgi:recombinational DNA repair protein RecT